MSIEERSKRIQQITDDVIMSILTQYISLKASKQPK